MKFYVDIHKAFDKLEALVCTGGRGGAGSRRNEMLLTGIKSRFSETSERYPTLGQEIIGSLTNLQMSPEWWALNKLIGSSPFFCVAVWERNVVSYFIYVALTSHIFPGWYSFSLTYIYWCYGFIYFHNTSIHFLKSANENRWTRESTKPTRAKTNILWIDLSWFKCWFADLKPCKLIGSI